MNRKEAATEGMIRNYRNSMMKETLRIPRFQLMFMNQMSDWFGISKPNLLRLMVAHCRELENLEEYTEFPNSQKYLNNKVSFAFQLDREGQNYLEDLYRHLGVSKNHAMSLIISNSINTIGKRLEAARGTVEDPRNSSVVRGAYVSAELHAALMELREINGESISLLLKTAIEEHRTRTIEPDDSFRAEKKVSLRINAGNFDKMKVLCISSDMNLNEGVSGILKNFYFGVTA